MKKFGFTLAEILITIGIIGLVSAFVVPQIQNVIPDKNKTKVLKAYRTISSINEEILNDSSIYLKGEEYTIGGVTYACTGLDCLDKPANPKYSNAEGIKKYFKILEQKMNIDGNATITDNKWMQFKTRDGLYWTVGVNGTTTSDDMPIRTIATPITYYSFTIDTNGDKTAPNCAYSSTNCKKPDRFVLYGSNLGSVIAGDSLSIAYLNNPDKMNNKKADFETASKTKSNNPKTNPYIWDGYKKSGIIDSDLLKNLKEQGT